MYIEDIPFYVYIFSFLYHLVGPDLISDTTGKIRNLVNPSEHLGSSLVSINLFFVFFLVFCDVFFSLFVFVLCVVLIVACAYVLSILQFFSYAELLRCISQVISIRITSYSLQFPLILLKNIPIKIFV